MEPQYSTQQDPTPPIPAPSSMPMDNLPKTSPPPRHIPKKLAILVLIVIGFIFIGGLISAYFMKQNSNNEIAAIPTPTPVKDQVACTQDAKQCPDGSYVSRQGPNCEFTKCPEIKNGSKQGWLTYVNKGANYSIEYPNTLDANCEDIYGCGFHPKEENPDDNNFFRIKNITDDPNFDPESREKILEQMKMKVGEKKTFDETIFERLPDKSVANINAVVITNPHEEGMTRKAYLLYKGDDLYLIDGFYGTTNLTEKDFDEIVLSFKFTN